jgi:two-component system, response regulator
MTDPVILLVDDNRDDVDVALRAVRREQIGVEIYVAHDGLEALEALGLEPGAAPAPLTPRAIFLDLKMPRVDGWEVLRRLRTHPKTKDLPIIVLSWSARPEDIERCYALGANSFLVKRATLTPGAAFAEAVRYWISLNLVPCSA